APFLVLGTPLRRKRSFSSLLAGSCPCSGHVGVVTSSGRASRSHTRTTLDSYMRRLLLPASAIVVAAALVALFVFAISGQGANTTIDSQLARGTDPATPGGHTALPVLGSSRRISLADLRGKVIVLNV